MITEFNINSNISKDHKLIEIKNYIDQKRTSKAKNKVRDVGGGDQNKANMKIDALFDVNDVVNEASGNNIQNIKKDFCT